MDEEPELSREIAKVAWLVGKLLLAIATPLTLIVLLAMNHPRLAFWLSQGLTFGAIIVFYGYQNYKWKKSNWEDKKRYAAEDEKWVEAKQRLRRDARE